MQTWLVPLVIVAISITVAVVFSQGRASRAEIGKPAPDFALEDLNGNIVRLSDFRGQVVFINFWTTWCDACREEMPDLVQFHKDYGDRVVQIGINVREPSDKITAFMKLFGAKYLVLRDKDARVSESYRLRGYPESWFIDADGMARVYHIGGMSYSQMVAAYRTASDGAGKGEQEGESQ